MTSTAIKRTAPLAERFSGLHWESNKKSLCGFRTDPYAWTAFEGTDDEFDKLIYIELEAGNDPARFLCFNTLNDNMLN